MNRIQQYLLIIILGGLLFSCRKSFDNPNAADEEEAFGSAEGMIRVIVGMKHRFAVNSSYGNGTIFNAITICGFITNETSKKNGANPDFAQFEKGGCSVASNNITLSDLWANCLLVNHTAGKLLSNAYKVEDLAIRQSIQANAYLYKAMTMGILAMFWKEQPEKTGTNAIFVSREIALQQALSLLRQALPLSNAIPQSQAVLFDTMINLKNTILALSARYNLMLGQYDSAFAYATKVNLNSKSAFYYNTINPNPLYRSAFSNLSGYLPSNKFGLPESLLPDSNDKRISFYTVTNNTSNIGFGKSDTDVIPVYLPGEMLLIISEYYARKNDFANAKLFLDSILTKTSTTDIFKVGAELPVYTGPMDQKTLLLEIYKNRCIELFMSGIKLEDSRRFGIPERSLDFLPYPISEKINNPNTPPDPGC